MAKEPTSIARTTSRTGSFIPVTGKSLKGKAIVRGTL